MANSKHPVISDPRNFMYWPPSATKMARLRKLPRAVLQRECKAEGAIRPTMTLKEIEALAEKSLTKSKPDKAITPDEVVILYKRMLKACIAFEDTAPIKEAILKSTIQLTGADFVKARERINSFLDELHAAFEERDRQRKAN